MPVSEEYLTKGNEVWTVHYAGADWLHSADHVPFLRHGIVTGGGEQQSIIQWDGDRNPDRESKYRAAQRVSSTRLEAWKVFREAMTAKREEFSQRMDRSAGAAHQASLEIVRLESESAE
jgi:hypothetical protein